MSIDSDHAGFLDECAIFGVLFKNSPAPPQYTPPGGVFALTLTPAQGITSAVAVSAKYSGNINAENGIITVNAKLTVLADNSNDLMILKINNPIVANFTGAAQAQVSNFTIIKTTNLNLPGAIGDGCFHDLYAEVGAGIILVFEGSQPAVEYILNAGWSYQIQAAPLPLGKKK